MTAGRDLHRLARLHGVQPVWRDVEGEPCVVADEVLVRVLSVLGVDCGGGAPEAVAEALRARDADRLAPVVAAGEGEAPRIALRFAAGEAGDSLDATLRAWDPEEGTGEDLASWRVDPASLPGRPAADGGVTRAWELPLAPAAGYHELVLAGGGREDRARIVVAPAGTPPIRRGWGAFAPLSAVRSAGDWGLGGFAELGALAERVGGLGGDTVATLPLCASDAADPSPYSPLSRRFWNEVFLDVERVPELERSPEARRLLASPEHRVAIEALRASDLADFARVAARKREVLALFAASLRGSTREAELEAFLERRPEVREYARFRAATERFGAGWPAWPERARDGEPPADLMPEEARYHAYVQWLCVEQLAEARRRAEAAGARLFLDLPIGVRGDGYDVWRARHEFLVGASAGAPPDDFFRAGQTWGFPPPHPIEARRSCHASFALAVRRHAEVAGILRLDHVMSLHRLWVVPAGASAAAGAYARYPARELYAILCLEAARAGCAVVGEDLGTVPAVVRERMGEHGLHRTVVLPFAFDPGHSDAPVDLPERCVAALETHDLAPFAGFWEAHDVEEHLRIGIVDQGLFLEALRGRLAFRAAWIGRLRSEGLLDGAPTTWNALRASLSFLARSPAAHVQVRLDDLWLETRSHNVPGTTSERPNWRLRHAVALEELAGRDGVRALADELGAEGRRGPGASLGRPAGAMPGGAP